MKYIFGFLVLLLGYSCSKKTSVTYVSNYGAKGDGVVDDTRALQKAIDESKNFVYLDKKKYKISRPLNLKSNLSIVGNGAQIILHPNAKINAITIHNIQNVSIDDLVIVGQMLDKITSATTGRDRNLIHCKNSQDISLNNLTLKSHPYTTAYFADVTNLEINNCLFEKIGKGTSWDKYPYYSYDAIFLGGVSSSKNISINECQFSNIGQVAKSEMPIEDGDAIHIQTLNDIPISHIQISNCLFEKCSSRGIKIQSGSNIEITKNEFKSCNAGVGMTMVSNLDNILIEENNFINVNYSTGTNHKGYKASNVSIIKNYSQGGNYFFRASGGSILSNSKISENKVVDIGFCFIDAIAENLEVSENSVQGYAVAKDKSYHMAMLFANGSENLKIFNNTITATQKTKTAIYLQNEIRGVEIQRNKIKVPPNTSRKYLIVDHSKSFDVKSDNSIIEIKQ